MHVSAGRGWVELGAGRLGGGIRNSLGGLLNVDPMHVKVTQAKIKC